MLESSDGGLDYFACDARTGRLRQIFTDLLGDGGSQGIVAARIGSRTLACVLESGGYDGEGDGELDFDMVGLDMTTGKRFTVDIGEDGSDVSNFDGSSDVFKLHGLFIGPSGAVAWLSSQSDYVTNSEGQPSGQTTWGVNVADATGVRSVAAAEQTTSTAPLSDLQITRSDVTFDNQGQTASAPIGSF